MKKYKLIIQMILLISALIFTSTAFAASTSIMDYAGNGQPAYKDGENLKASFNFPYGLAMDKDGGLIVVDSYNNMIRKVLNGEVTTIAGFSDRKDVEGNPAGGFKDGDTAKAMFNKPRYAAVDSNGNIFVSDTGNNAIRKISKGKVYTYAGNGTEGCKNGKGSVATLNAPSGLAIDKDNNIYVADTLNHVIRMITPKGDVTTFAGVGTTGGGYKDGSSNTAMFNEPTDVTIDNTGALYVLDSGNQVVRKIENGQVSTFAGSSGVISSETGYAEGGFADGKRNEARFNFPKGLCIADDGTIFIADTWNHRIRAIKTDGSVVTVVGTGVSGKSSGILSEAMLDQPVDILYSAGNLYISDMWNNCIRVISIDTGDISGLEDKNELIKGIDFAPASSEIQVWVNKERVVFPDVKPYISEGKTYVPLRFVYEKWGARVTSLPKGKIEVIKGSMIKLFNIETDPILIKDGRTMIDTENLCEISGFKLLEVPEFNAIVILTQD